MTRHVALAVVHCPETHRVLLVTSRKHAKLWIFPKGGVEKNETSGQAAAREAHEEAGIPSSMPPESISPQLTEFDMAGKKPEVWHVHAVSLSSEESLLPDWDESEERKREWLDPSDALERFKKWGGGVHDESKKKKAAKGDAMERALNAYASKFGWDK